MRAPYQVVREQSGEQYHFKLVRYENGKVARVLSEATGNSPIAPEWMRNTQARLNSKLVLNDIVH